ncbi:MAG TPA: hypothetical protein VFO60_06430, partial [Candidatus Dormibacteraeota bacterium]|nr:hypothetical protein [Candidatus Dormibacteraeota bacterium]
RLLTALGASLPPLTRTIDMLMLTGGERAATAGLVGLDAHYRIGRVVVPDADLGTATRAAVLTLREAGSEIETIPVNATWRWDGAEWRCAGATPPADPTTTITPVCALQVADGPSSALVAGDMTSPAQDEVSTVDGEGLRSQLLVGPPDGLLAAGFATAVAPRLLAIPCSRAPSAHAAVTTRTTAQDGTLRYSGGPNGIGGAA